MPTHFGTIQEFRDLITKRGVASVLVSQDDFNFLWERVDPRSRYSTQCTIMILNNRDEVVKVATKLRGTLDLTGPCPIYIPEKA